MRAMRQTMVDALNGMEATDAVDAVQPLLDDPNPHVREAAE
jgi:hypothetical protein